MSILEYVESLPDLESWDRFVKTPAFWRGQPEVIKALEDKWKKMPGTSGERGNSEFWNEVEKMDEDDLWDLEIPAKKARYSCPVCDKSYGKNCEMLRHHREKHTDSGLKCKECGKSFQSPKKLKMHNCQNSEKFEEPKKEEILKPEPSADYNESHRAETKVLKGFRYNPHYEMVDYGESLTKIIPMVKEKIEQKMEKEKATKYQLKTLINFHRSTDDEETCKSYFCLKPRRVLQSTNIGEQLQNYCEGLADQIEQFCQNGSNWVVENIGFYDLDLFNYRPDRGSSYIPTPKSISSKKAIVNVQNEDNACFKWSILSALHQAEFHTEQLSKYECFQEELDFTNIQFPVTIDQIGKFEDLNNLRINVFGYEKSLYPVRITKHITNPDEIINLLLLTKGQKSHYCWIKDLNTLFTGQTKHESRKFVCPSCLFPFTSEERRDEHIQYCQTGTQRIEMPEDGEKLRFKNVKNQLITPFVIYADFECSLVKISTCAPDPDNSSTTKIHQHMANSFAAKCVQKCGCGGNATYTPIVLKRKENAAAEFLQYCLTQGEKHQQTLDNAKPLDKSKVDWRKFYATKNCTICNKDMNGEKGVCDHCHICGNFRGRAHDICNLEYKQQRDVPVVFHNLRRYDGHLIMQALGKIATEKKMAIECIPKGLEDYLTFSIEVKHKRRSNGKIITWKLRFIDSYQFLTSSLANLVSNLAEKDQSGEPKFHALRSEFSNLEDRKLLLRKGVYPYEYIDGWDKFKEGLPSQDKFYSNLTLEGVSDEDYSHAKKVWDHFNFKEFGEYHDLYLKSDVLLLIDVFESFRETCAHHYGLDPVHYITLPSFSWDACLKFSNVTLDLISDPDMYSFFESSIRGGVSMITHRHAKANNELLEEFDAKKEKSYIMYLDANNLYGWAMSQFLPISDFEWMSESEIENLNVPNVPDNAEIGYVLEVDLDYPKELHNSHNDYPLAPESIIITEEMLSPYSKEIKKELGMISGNVKKLTPNLHDKKHYVVHYRNLKFYLEKGMKMIKVHRAVKFHQSPWLLAYIDFNTKQRAQAKTSFEKDFFKLLNNAVFGKSMENVRHYVNVKLSADTKKQEKWIASSLFKDSAVFNDNLMAISMENECVKLCKPIYTGFVVLEDSKVLMYRFAYNYIKKRFGERAQLLFTDTDSLCFEIKSNDIYKEFQEDSHHFDFSDNPSDHPLFSVTNKKVIGKMKDEMNGEPIIEFVGLRAKMYSVLQKKKVTKKAKGITKAVVKKIIEHQDYIDSLFKKQKRKDTMTRIHHQLHELYTVTQVKTSLSCFDDKRYILADGVSTLAHGHYLTNV